jgi:hypothetical protein
MEIVKSMGEIKDDNILILTYYLRNLEMLLNLQITEGEPLNLRFKKNNNLN